VAQVVKRLLCEREALSSNPSNAKKKKKRERENLKWYSNHPLPKIISSVGLQVSSIKTFKQVKSLSSS
jgi:hypothetical protein